MFRCTFIREAILKLKQTKKFRTEVTDAYVDDILHLVSISCRQMLEDSQEQ